MGREEHEITPGQRARQRESMRVRPRTEAMLVKRGRPGLAIRAKHSCPSHFVVGWCVSVRKDPRGAAGDRKRPNIRPPGRGFVIL